MYKRVIFGDVTNDVVADLKDINQRETFILSALAIAVLLFGLYPAPLFDAMHPTLEHLFEQMMQTKLNP
jgi:NADH-quinone oxidoreductase subunit M